MRQHDLEEFTGETDLEEFLLKVSDGGVESGDHDQEVFTGVTDLEEFTGETDLDEFTGETGLEEFTGEAAWPGRVYG